MPRLGPSCWVSDGPSDPHVDGQCGTCADGLPAHGERSPGLNGVHGDGAVVVRPRSPGQLSSGVCDFINGHGLGRAWGTCRRARPSGMGRWVPISEQVVPSRNRAWCHQALPHLVPGSSCDTSLLNTSKVPSIPPGSEASSDRDVALLPGAQVRWERRVGEAQTAVEYLFQCWTEGHGTQGPNSLTHPPYVYRALRGPGHR